MGRLIAVVLFIAVMVPAALLARAWGLEATRRAIATAGVEWAAGTPEGDAALRRQALHGRRWRQAGFGAGVLGIIATVVLYAEASVFLWVPVLAVGLLLGVLMAEATRPRPGWALSRPVRRPRRTEQISLWLLWTMRVVLIGELVSAWSLWSSGYLDVPVARAAVVVPVACWALAEVALLRALLRPVPESGADLPVDEALRTWTVHLAVAAASVVGLLPLGGLLLVAGVDLGDQASSGIDLLPVGLVAGGFSALSAGLAVTVFLLTWLRPLRRTAPALAG